MTIKVCVFDAYGTLFDVTAAARLAAEAPGQEKLAAVWQDLAAHWRNKQLQYTWLRAVTGEHCDFWQVTQDSLDWAMDAAGLDDPELRERLLALYWELAAYKDALFMLPQLKAAGMQIAILSNGSPDMLDGAVSSAQIEPYLDAVLSVEAVGIFKPAATVYDLVGQRFGTAPQDVLFVSANGWDAASAASYGFHTAWINRNSDPVDRLPGRPASTLPDLTGIVELAARL